MAEVPLAGPELGGLQREAHKAGAPPQTPKVMQEAEGVGAQERVHRDELLSGAAAKKTFEPKARRRV